MLLASALSGVLAAPQVASAQNSPSSAFPGAGTSGATAAGSPAQTSAANGGSTPTSQPAENIQVKIQRRLTRLRNPPSAATELGTKQIAQVGVQGSPSTLLRQAPSVNVYQQGIGNNEPVLSIRGIRGLESAQTLDGVPMQDLLYGGTGPYLSSLIGGKFDLSQISGVDIYPGVAFPSDNTFGTIGGTVAYTSLRPTDERGIDVFGSVGSFKTFQEGITLNSGKLDGFLGSGYDAPKIMAQYTNLQTAGFIDYTPARYNNLEVAFDKPYDGGLSKFQATVLYNTGNGYYTNEPIPTPYLQRNGMFSNYSPDDLYAKENNQFATVLLEDNTYINDWLTVGANVFYEYTNSDNQAYLNPSDVYQSAAFPGAQTINGANPFVTNIAGFGTYPAFGPNGPYYDPAVGISYDGNAAYPPGSAGCPVAVAAAAGGGKSPCGYSTLRTLVQTDTYGIQPHITITPPDKFGIRNTIQIGALIAKETSPFLPSYASGVPSDPENPGNIVAGAFGGQVDGGTSRAIYQVYAQDKIDALNRTLHITPGVTFEASESQFTSSSTFGGTPTAHEAANPYCAGQTAAYNAAGGAGNPANPNVQCQYGQYNATLWDKDILPFINVTYDFDRILPAAKGLSAYGSYGESALFAPVNDFSPNTFGLTPPTAAIVHLAEGGLRYNTSRFAVTGDYFYQKVDRDFGFFQYQSGPLQGLSAYNNLGGRIFQGQEFQVLYQLTPRWQLFGNFSHTRARYTATDVGDVTIQEDQFGDVIRGTPITGVPTWLSTAGVDYDHKSWFIPHDDFHVRFEGQYTGRQATSYDVTGFQNLGPIPSVSPYGTYGYYTFTSGATTYDPNGGIEPYVIFNLDVNYEMPVAWAGNILKKLDADLNFQNLFDKHYYQYRYKQISPSAPFTFTSGPFAGQSSSNYTGQQFQDELPGEPFAVTFTLKAHF